nr:unnamed protein product [Callosobruchus analis]
MGVAVSVSFGEDRGIAGFTWCIQRPSAAELFTKEALLWYRTTRASSWDDLCNQLRDTFLPHDYEYGLWDEIRSRTQGTNEKVVNFVVVMESLFRKLREPVSEHTKVNIIQRNFLPYIQRQLALHPVTTVSQIMSMARSIEEAHVRAQSVVAESNFQLMPSLRPKKLSGGSSIGHMADTPQQQTFMANPPQFENKILLDYIVAHAKGDQRPYLTVNIYGCNFFGLLDSGASRTIIGAPSWKKLSTVCKLLPTTGETVRWRMDKVVRFLASSLAYSVARSYSHLRCVGGTLTTSGINTGS